MATIVQVCFQELHFNLTFKTKCDRYSFNSAASEQFMYHVPPLPFIRMWKLLKKVITYFVAYSQLKGLL